MNKNGRPSSYDPKRTPELARALALSGKVDKEIAELLGIDKKTLNTWKRKHPEFLHSLKGGKDPVDDSVETALLQRAMGYSYDEEKMIVDTSDGARVVKVEKTKKHVAPDVTACIFWLKNRRPEAWRDVKRIEATGKDGGPVKVENEGPGFDPSKLSPDQLMQLADLMDAATLDE